MIFRRRTSESIVQLAEGLLILASRGYDQMSMHIHGNQLVHAIQMRNVVELSYQSEEPRTVEPYALFRDRSGGLYLSAYQVSGFSTRSRSAGWKTFDVRRLSYTRILDEQFVPREDYNPAGVADDWEVIAEVV